MTAWKSVVGADDTVLNGGDVALAGSLGEHNNEPLLGHAAHQRVRRAHGLPTPPAREPARAREAPLGRAACPKERPRLTGSRRQWGLNSRPRHEEHRPRIRAACICWSV